MILSLAKDHEALITVEEGASGGFGAHVMQLLSQEGVFDYGLKFRSMVMPDAFVDQAKPDDMYAEAGLNAKGFETMALSLLGVSALSSKA